MHIAFHPLILSVATVTVVSIHISSDAIAVSSVFAITAVGFVLTG